MEKNESCEPNKKDSFLKMYNGTLSSWLFPQTAPKNYRLKNNNDS